MAKKSAKIAVTYFVTIISSLVLIGGVGYFALNAYLNSDGSSGNIIQPATPEAPSVLDAEDYVPTSADSSSVLVIYEDEKKNTSTCFALARFVPMENKMVMMPLQTDICTVLDGKANTLYEFYRLGGISSAKRAVEEATGVKIDKYMKFSRESFTLFSNYMGNVGYTVPYNLIYEDTGSGESIIIQEGNKTLDAVSLRKVLTFPQYKGGEEYRAKVVGTLAAELVNSGAKGLLHDSLDAVFSDIINSDIETDITKYDYDAAKPAMQFVLDNTSSPAELVIPSGVYNENNCYVLDESFVQALPNWLYLE